jgi:hypothetical protein
MFHDFAARGLAAQNRRGARRLATIDALTRGIVEHMPKGLPVAMATEIAEERSATTQIGSGTTYGFDSATPANHMAHHFSLYGADWGNFLSSSPTVLQPITSASGNGTDPTANVDGRAGVSARFMTHADKFEIWAMNYIGFRVKVNGKYAKTGMYGVQALNGDPANTYYFLFDFTGTEFEGTGLKLVEIVADASFRFKGARVPMGHTISPWPQAVPLKVGLHGDSKVTTVSDSVTDHRTQLHGQMPLIVQALTGVSDIWAINQPGCGFFNDLGGTRSDFVEAATANIAGRKFDVVWSGASVNDWNRPADQAACEAKVEEWLGIVLADNPDAIVILSGPWGSGNTQAYQGNTQLALLQRAEKAVAARHPRNCAFIETIGNAVTNDPWIFGTGTVSNLKSDGNADLIQVTDGIHFSTGGHPLVSARLVAETAKVLPLLTSRIRDGVIAGVNDTDLR